MLSPETLESYRKMTPSQRLKLTFELSQSAWSALLEGEPEIVARRFKRLELENDLRNRRICEGLRRAENRQVAEPGRREK